MRVVSGCSLILASLVATGAYAAPIASRTNRLTGPTSSSAAVHDPELLAIIPRAAATTDITPAGDITPDALERLRISCGLKVTTKEDISTGNCLDRMVFTIVEPVKNAGVQPTRREDPSPTEPSISQPSLDSNSDPIFYGTDIAPRPVNTQHDQLIPVISAFPPEDPGGPSITKIVGHLSIVLDNPAPPTSTPEPTSLYYSRRSRVDNRE